MSESSGGESLHAAEADPPPVTDDSVRDERKRQLKAARKQARELLALMEIDSVVVVDDEARLDASLYLAAFVHDRERAHGLPDDYDWDAMDDPQWREQIRLWFESLDKDQQGKEYNRALSHIQRYGDVAAPIDLAFLRQLLEDIQLHLLQPEEWEAQREDLTGGDKAERVLVLFDRNLGEGRAEEGITLLANYLQGTAEARAAVLTTEVEPDEEVTRLAEFTASCPEVRDRTLLASKGRLTLEKSASFLNLLRLTANLPALHGLRDGFLAQADSYHDAGRKTLEAIPVQVLEDVVFRSSLSEGAWEIDTLSRVLALLTQDAARKAMPENAPAPDMLARVRKLAGACVVTHEPSLERARTIMAGERWTPIEYVNALGLPLANGDVFRFANRLWILMCQPCDLIVRNKEGARKARNSVTLLPLELRKHAKSRDESEDGMNRRRYHDLPFGFADVEGRNLLMNFAPWLDVRVEVLDLCAFNSKGIAEYDRNANGSRPEPLTPGLKKLRAGLDAKAEDTLAIVRRLRRLKNPEELLARVLAVEPSGVLAPDVPGTTTTVLRYHCERVARLSAPYADAALTALSAERAREAHEHDLDRFGNPRSSASS